MSEKKEKRKSALFGRGSSKSKGKDSKATEEPQVVVGDADAATTPEVPKQQSEKDKKSKRKSVSALLPKGSSDSLSEESSREGGKKRVCQALSQLLLTYLEQ